MIIGQGGSPQILAMQARGPEVSPTMLVKRPDMAVHNLQSQCWRSIDGKILGAGWSAIIAQSTSPGR